MQHGKVVVLYQHGRKIVDVDAINDIMSFVVAIVYAVIIKDNVAIVDIDV